MNVDKLQNGAMWVDIIVKSLIGALVAIVGWDYRNVKSHLEELQTARYTQSADVRVIQSELNYIRKRVDSIDNKLDRAIK